MGTIQSREKRAKVGEFGDQDDGVSEDSECPRRTSRI